MNNLDKIYKRRFKSDSEFRNKMYQILCKEVFQKYIPKNASVLDIAAGYCEFINSIKAKKKIALDIKADVKDHASKDVTTIKSTSTNMKMIKGSSIDLCFVSNFFEHITRDDIVKTIKEINRVLKNGGKLLVLQPNIRYCYKDYWMFFDHITPLDDRSITEILEVNGFKVTEVKPRFLPYTSKGRLPKSALLIKLYLKLPILQYVVGQQAFIVAEKAKGSTHDFSR